MDIGSVTISCDQTADKDLSALSDLGEAAFADNGFTALPRITSEQDVSFIRATLMRLFAEQVGRSEGMLFDFAGPDEETGRPRLPQLLDPRSFAPELIKTEFFHNADQLRDSFWDRRLVSLRAMRC